LVSSKLQAIKQGLLADVAKGKTPAEMGVKTFVTAGDMRKLRTQIGEMIESPGDIPVSQLKHIYKGLSEDLEELAKSKGQDAYLAMKRANQFTRQGHDKLEMYLQPLEKGTYQSIYQKATAGTKDGAEQVRETLSALNPVQQDAVRATFTTELGRKGEQFDPQQFFTRWGELHPEAKDALYGKTGPMRSALDKVAAVSVDLARKGTTLSDLRSFALEHGSEGGLAALAFLTHHYGMANILIGGRAGGFLSGRLLQNPKFVSWLAKASTKTPGSLIGSLNQLAQQSAELPEADQAEVAAYIQNIRSLGEPK
jgi:hypothetical protein